MTHNPNTLRAVILFNSAFPYAGGGRETGLYNLSRFSQGSLRIDAVTMRAPRNSIPHFHDAHRFLMIHPVFSWQGLLQMRGYNHIARKLDFRTAFTRIMRTAQRLATSIRPNAVISFDAGPLGLAALTIANSIGARSVVNMRAFFTNELAHTTTLPRRRRTLYEDMERKVVNMADLVLCNGLDTDIFCQQLGRTKQTEIVYNGVDLDTFCPAREVGIRHAYGASPRDVVFISNNPIREIKGPQDAIRAFAALPQTHREQSRLAFLGKGDFSPFLRLVQDLKVTERVVYLGFANHSTLARYLGAADVAIHPVKFSAGTTHASLETLACGLPQISYDSASLATTCTSDTGILVPNGDVKGLSAAMKRMIDEPSTRARCSHAALALAQEFSWARYVDRFLSALRHCVAESPQ